ncbi:MAG: protein kinase [Gammaproteobacteria bacterium]|nr:protein kinase [Gammaproteobacteria bacterium]
MEPHRTGRNEPKSRVLEPGRTLGSYLVLRTVSVSPRSTIHMAQDLALDRPVALKSAPRGAASVVHEARALARLNHPHIVTLYALWPQPQALVLEYLVGETLKARRDHGDPLSADALRAWMIDTAAALEAVHAQGLAHGAIHADSLFLTAEGTIKLLDFRQSGIGDAPATAADDLRALGRLIGELATGQADMALTDIGQQAVRGRFADARALRLALATPARRKALAITAPHPVAPDAPPPPAALDDWPAPSINPMVPVFDARPGWAQPDRWRKVLLGLTLVCAGFLIAMNWLPAWTAAHHAAAPAPAITAAQTPRPAITHTQPVHQAVTVRPPATTGTTGAYAALARAWGG